MGTTRVAEGAAGSGVCTVAAAVWVVVLPIGVYGSTTTVGPKVSRATAVSPAKV